MDEIKIKQLRAWTNGDDFEDFCKKISALLPTNSKGNRKQARELYDLLKAESDDSIILSRIEDTLEEREKKGITKGLVLGAISTIAVGALATYLLKKNEDNA